MADTARPSIRSVRVRVTALTVLAVAVVLIAGGWWVQRNQGDELDEVVERAARTRLEDLSVLVTASDVPAELPEVDEDGTVAQIVAADGSVLRASAAVADDGPIGAMPELGVTVRGEYDHLPWDDDAGIVLSRAVAGPGGTLAVHVGVNTDQVTESVEVLRRSMYVGIPIVLALLAGLIWLVVGAMLRRVVASAERQQQLVDDVSHELRSPLARMRTQLEVDLAHPSGADPAATARSLLDDVRRLEGIVDDTLLLARTSNAQRRAQAVSLDEVIGETCALYGVAPPVETGLVVDGRRTELARALANVLDNARRHAAGEVQVTVTSAGGTGRIEVTDDGPGIPAGAHARIFERFVRGDAARPTDPVSVGLGLAITRQIVEQHGGRVWADPDHTPGARIVIELPVQPGVSRSPG